MPPGTKSSEFNGIFATFIFNSISNLSSSEPLWLVLALLHTGLLELESAQMRERGEATGLRMKYTDDENSVREREMALGRLK